MPVAYYLGKDFKPAKRKSAKSLTFWNCWGQMSEGCAIGAIGAKLSSVVVAI